MASTERNVAIVGAGLIGRAWAAIFARAGWNVRLSDPHIPTLKAAPRLIRDELHALARHGLAADPDRAITRVSVAASLAEAVVDVEFVQENGPERVEDKQTIFAQLDKLAPKDALLVSSTSAIVASRFTEVLPGRARCLIGHPVNPPHLIPLVEVVGGDKTSTTFSYAAQVGAVVSGSAGVDVAVARQVALRLGVSYDAVAYANRVPNGSLSGYAALAGLIVRL